MFDIKEEKQKVLEAGGLKIIGTERHESRRIDNQLRGRSGRQGDVGESRFYISMEDKLMKLFGGEKLQAIANFIKVSEDTPIEAKLLTGTIENAQKNVESMHFAARKNVLQYDDVMNDQRKVIYEQRKDLMVAQTVTDTLKDIRDDCIQTMIYQLAPSRSVPEHWDADELREETYKLLALDVPFTSWVNEPGISPETMVERLSDMSLKSLKDKLAILPEDMRNSIEKNILIQFVQFYY